MTESLVFVGVSPHPPIIVPAIGGPRLSEVSRTVAGVRNVMQRLVASRPDCTIIVSPHVPSDYRSFTFYSGPRVRGDFNQFGAPDVTCDLGCDQMLLSRIVRLATESTIPNYLIHAGRSLDHGAMVPISFLIEAGYRGKLLVMGPASLPVEVHLDAGAVVARAAQEMGTRLAIVASGDLSHRLRPGAPAGYDPDAHEFDDQIVDGLGKNDAQSILEIDPGLREKAAEDIFLPLLIALGAMGSRLVRSEVCSYERPFGVGYLAAVLAEQEETISAETALPALAREAVAAYLKTGEVIRPDPIDASGSRHRAGVFVCIKDLQGALRGCVGTISPACPSIAEEIVQNAISAATRDARFSPVQFEELDLLRFTVDILSPLELINSPSELDPGRFGVAVEAAKGRRGTLLPNLPGIHTVEEQLKQVRSKAGIEETEPMKIWRFSVARYPEPITS